MSGHSKWSTIKRKKGANDAKKAQLFTKLVKEIAAAVKQGGPIPENNPRLRIAIQNAKGNSVPKENIDRAIKKSEEKDSASYFDVTYEGYGPAGVAFIVECISDNVNRTISYVRAAFTRHEGSVAKTGAVGHLFDKKGVFCLEKNQVKDIDNFTLSLIDAGAESIDLEDDFYYITCKISDFGSVQKELDSLGIVVKSSKIEYIAGTLLPIEKDHLTSVEKLVDALEEIDDVQYVYTNAGGD